jgi:4-carboxymuconolactone decarboxylase
MRLEMPRIFPVPEPEWNEAQRSQLAPMAARGPVLNVFKTIARDSEALKAFLPWGSYILSRRNALAPRERQIVILRTGFLCRAGYEWAQHVPIGLRAGLTDEEIARIKRGAPAPGWNALDTALLEASDELHRDQFVGDATWAALKAHLTDKQCMDVVFTAGQYTQVCMMLNSFGVQLDDGQALDPDFKPYPTRA